MTDREHLPTERTLPGSGGLDTLGSSEAFDVFDRADRVLADAVCAAKEPILAAIDLVVERLARGGRLIYVGAGTSGRLGMLDAVECPPTFGCEPERVQGRLAGGPGAFVRATEGSEDSRAEGAHSVGDVTERDVVFGISAGGTTPFVHAALAAARERGAATVFLACVPDEAVRDDADVSIRLDTGPEVLAGSTRLKAGTATKMVLNRVTTLAMARLGHVYDNRMVDMAAGGNAKLGARAEAILRDLTGLAPAAARTALERAGGDLKTAILAERLGLGPADAAARLAAAKGSLRRALEAEAPLTGS